MSSIETPRQPKVDLIDFKLTPSCDSHLLIVGLYPITPLQAAEILISPSESLPSAKGTIPAPTDPPDPPHEPPAEHVSSRADFV